MRHVQVLVVRRLVGQPALEVELRASELLAEAGVHRELAIVEMKPEIGVATRVDGVCASGGV